MTAIPYEQIAALNWSTLKHLAISPRLLQWRSEHPREDTDALARGRWIHRAALEPARWASSHVVRPDFGDLRTKKAKAARAEWLVTLPPDVDVLTADEQALVRRCSAAILANPGAAQLLKAGRCEEIITWVDEETGLDCKARLDFVAPTYVVDLKSTRQQTLRSMARDFAVYLYHGQLAWYHDGAIAARALPPEPDGPFTIAVQTVEPYDVVPGRLMREDLERGRSLYRSLLRRFVECKAADWWPGLAPDVIDFALPSWAPAGDPTCTEDW